VERTGGACWHFSCSPDAGRRAPAWTASGLWSEHVVGRRPIGYKRPDAGAETAAGINRRRDADARTDSVVEPIENLRGQIACALDALGRRLVAGVVDFREQLPDVADALADDRFGRVALGHVGGDGLGLADPAPGGAIDRQFLRCAQLVVEFVDQLGDVRHGRSFVVRRRERWVPRVDAEGDRSIRDGADPHVGTLSAAATDSTDMTTIEEKRIFAEKSGRTRAFVGSAVGVAAVSVSADLVGEFGVEYRTAATDIAGRAGQIAVATGEDVVLLGEDPLELGFGPAAAVGFRDGAVVAGDEDGRVATATDPDEWREVGRVDGTVRAIDGDLVATSDGVCRLGETLESGGHDFDAAADVASGDIDLAATADGVYRWDDGWQREMEGKATLVAADVDGRAHAVVDGVFYARASDGKWSRVELPVDAEPVGVAYGPATYVATADGTFLVDAGDGWRHQHLGLRGVVGCAVAE